MKIEQNVGGMFVAVIKSDNGKLRRVKLHTNDRAEAEKIAAENGLDRIERMAINGLVTRSLIRQMTAVGKVLVHEAIEAWDSWLRSTSESVNTAANMKSYALAWMRDTGCKSIGIDEITEEDISRWVNKDDDCKASTRKFRLSVVRSLFWFCKEKQYRDDDPSQFVSVRLGDMAHEQKESRKKRVFTDEEFALLDAWIRFLIETTNNMKTRWVYTFWLCAIHIGRESALRLSDIASLEWASIGESFVVHTGKRNVRVKQPITPQLRAALDLIPKNTVQSKWCFPKQCIMSRDPRLRPQLSNQFSRILKQAGIENHTFHELRCTKITELSNAGEQLQHIVEFAGHSNPKTTQSYIAS